MVDPGPLSAATVMDPLIRTVDAVVVGRVVEFVDSRAWKIEVSDSLFLDANAKSDLAFVADAGGPIRVEDLRWTALDEDGDLIGDDTILFLQKAPAKGPRHWILRLAANPTAEGLDLVEDHFLTLDHRVLCEGMIESVEDGAPNAEADIRLALAWIQSPGPDGLTEACRSAIENEGQ